MPGVILVQKANSNLNDRGITFFAELVVEGGRVSKRFVFYT